MICPVCHTENTSQARTCTNCGHLLHEFKNDVFIKRQAEIDFLVNQGEILLAGLGRLCMVTGEVGMGKSRLIAEWKTRFNTHHPEDVIRWLEVIPNLMDHSQPYSYLRRLILTSFDLQEDATEQGISKALSEKSDLATSERQMISNILTGTGLTTPVLLDDHESDFLARISDAIKGIILSLSSSKPVIIIFENLQYADEYSIAVINEILPLAAQAPVLFCLVGGARLGSIKYLLHNLQKINVNVLQLAPFSREESDLLLASLLGTNLLPDGFQALIFEQNAGNPGFIIQTLQMLLQSGVIRQENGSLVIPKQLEKLAVPQSVMQILLQDIAFLSEKAQGLLRTASVLGYEFVPELLLEMQDGCSSKERLLRELNMLEAADFVRLHAFHPRLVYQFKGVMLQKALYQSIPAEERAQIHLSAARAIEKQNSEDPSQYAERLAYHYLEGEDLPKARQYYVLAAKSAQTSNKLPNAELSYLKALELVNRDKDKAVLLDGLGQVLFDQALYNDAIDAWKEALEVNKQQDNYDQAARLYAKLSRAYWWLNDLEQNKTFCHQGEVYISEKPECPGKAYLLHECGRTALFNDDLNNAQEYCSEALRLARNFGAVDVQAEVLATLGIFPTLNPREAISLLEESISLAESNNLPSSSVRAYINLAAIVEKQGEIRLALDYREKAVSLGVNSRNLQDAFYIQSGIINNHILLGQYDKARSQLDHIKQVSNIEQVPDVENLYSLVLESRLEQQLGNFNRASDLVLKYIRAEQQFGDEELVMMGNIRLSRILMEPLIVKDSQASHANIDIAIALLNEHQRYTGLPESKLQLYAQLALIHAIKGEHEKYESYWHLADGISNYAISKIARTQFNLVSARLAALNKDYKTAIDLFTGCAEVFDGMEARWWKAHTWLEMALVDMERKDAESLAGAQDLLRDSLLLFRNLGCEYYPDICLEKLRMLKHLSREVDEVSRTQKRELVEAGKVQTRFIPAEVPVLDEWDIAAILEPARETSGDYYDFIELPGGKFGIVIADVGDKGAGAALYMAMSRTMVRSLSQELGQTPEKLVEKLNQRIMQDTREGIFLTLVYGILDPEANTFTYTNAGHNPPVDIQPGKENLLDFLDPNGMLVGLFKEGHWHQKTIDISVGEAVVFYTDGITEAENSAGEFYGEKRLVEILKRNIQDDAQELLNAILEDIHSFTSGAPVMDDITLVVIKKKNK